MEGQIHAQDSKVQLWKTGLTLERLKFNIKINDK